jgi:hypothetical protein
MNLPISQMCNYFSMSFLIKGRLNNPHVRS